MRDYLSYNDNLKNLKNKKPQILLWFFIFNNVCYVNYDF